MARQFTGEITPHNPNRVPQGRLNLLMVLPGIAGSWVGFRLVPRKP